MNKSEIKFDTQGKFVPSGIVKTPIEFETKVSKAKLYNFAEIVETLKVPEQKYALAPNVPIGTVYKLMLELSKVAGLENITYGKLKGSKHELKTKKNKTIIEYQYVLYLGTEKYVPKVSKKKKQ